MSFLQHESCPNCSSKDNLARYADGSAWCFGCHYSQRRTHAPTKRGVISQELQETPRIPEDCGTSFSEEAVQWLERFYLDVPTAIKHGVLWSPSMQQIVYQLGSVWQARNFGKWAKAKNFTSGNVNECLYIYGHCLGDSIRASNSNEARLILVEDPVSAIRVGEAVGDCMPLLGSYLATSRLNALAGLYKGLVVWLDSDKYKEAREIAQRATVIGMSTNVIWTGLDPKCHTDEQLMEILT